MVGRFYRGSAMLQDQHTNLFYCFVFTGEELASVGNGEVGRRE